MLQIYTLICNFFQSTSWRFSHAYYHVEMKGQKKNGTYCWSTEESPLATRVILAELARQKNPRPVPTGTSSSTKLRQQGIPMDFPTFIYSHIMLLDLWKIALYASLFHWHKVTSKEFKLVKSCNWCIPWYTLAKWLKTSSTKGKLSKIIVVLN